MAGDLDLVRRLASAAPLAVLATTRPDGSVHASLVMAGVTDDPVSGTPAVAVVVAGAARKMGHLRRSGRATVAFTAGYQWVAVEGPVRIIGPDDPVEGFPPERLRVLLREVFTAAGGTHEDWEEYDRVMAAERRAAVFVAAARFSSND